MSGLNKDNNEWKMWEELFQYRKKWFENPVTEDEWRVCTQEAIDFGEKWKGLGQKLILALLEQMNEIAGEKENGIHK